MGCPDDNTLALLADGKLAMGEAERLREHVAGCATCGPLLAALGEASLGRGQRPDSPALASTLQPTPEVASPAAAADPSSPPSPPSPSTTPAPPAPAAAGAPLNPADPRPGQLVGGRYRLERLLGEGGMGSVWATEHAVTRQRFAIKLVRPAHLQKPAVLRRALREARAASAVRHPNVVRVVDVFEAEGGTPALVMDLLEGETLRQRLLREGTLSPAETARVLLPAMAAIDCAHEAGVIHRDLKPDNLFLVRGEGGAGEVRVVDFGLARLTAPGTSSGVLTQSGEMLGTPGYMSPEQAFGESDLDRRTDVWAMGVVLYECLAGRRPFEGDNFGQILRRITSGEHAPLGEAAPGLPPDLVALVEQMLQVKREARPADLRAVMKALAPHADSEVVARLPRRRLGGWLVRAAAVALVIGGAGVVASRRAGAPAPAAFVLDAAGPSLGAAAATPPPSGASSGAGRPVAAALGPSTPTASAGSAPAAPAPAAPAAASTIRLRVRTDPAAATLQLDGAPLGNPFEGTFERSAVRHELTASAPGFRTRAEWIQLDADRELVLSLPRRAPGGEAADAPGPRGPRRGGRAAIDRSFPGDPLGRGR